MPRSAGAAASSFGPAVEDNGRVLRVVTLADDETVHNAFPDRNYVIASTSNGGPEAP